MIELVHFFILCFDYRIEMTSFQTYKSKQHKPIRINCEQTTWCKFLRFLMCRLIQKFQAPQANTRQIFSGYMELDNASDQGNNSIPFEKRKLSMLPMRSP